MVGGLPIAAAHGRRTTRHGARPRFARRSSGMSGRRGSFSEREEAMVHRNEIICFANDWSSDPLSKKQIMLRLARQHRILWINSINNRRPRLGRKDFRRILQKLRDFGHGLMQVEERIW